MLPCQHLTLLVAPHDTDEGHRIDRKSRSNVFETLTQPDRYISTKVYYLLLFGSVLPMRYPRTFGALWWQWPIIIQRRSRLVCIAGRCRRLVLQKSGFLTPEESYGTGIASAGASFPFHALMTSATRLKPDAGRLGSSSYSIFAYPSAKQYCRSGPSS